MKSRQESKRVKTCTNNESEREILGGQKVKGVLSLSSYLGRRATRNGAATIITLSGHNYRRNKGQKEGKNILQHANLWGLIALLTKGAAVEGGTCGPIIKAGCPTESMS